MENLEKKAKELQNEYQRKYRSMNRDRIKTINSNYWLRKAAKALQEEKIKGGK